MSEWLVSQFGFISTLSYVRFFHCCQWQLLWDVKTCLCSSCPLCIQLNSRLWGDSWCPVLLPSCHVWSVSHWDSCLHFFLYADLPVTKVKKHFSLSPSIWSQLSITPCCTDSQILHQGLNINVQDNLLYYTTVLRIIYLGSELWFLYIKRTAQAVTPSVVNSVAIFKSESWKI